MVRVAVKLWFKDFPFIMISIWFICFLITTEAISLHAVRRTGDSHPKAIIPRTTSALSTRSKSISIPRARRATGQEPAFRRADNLRSSTSRKLTSPRPVKSAAHQNDDVKGFNGNEHIINGHSGHGGSGGLLGRYKGATKYPPATATALANSPGYLITHAKDFPTGGSTERHNAEDRSEGISVQARLAAFAVAASDGSGGQATASGYRVVAARIRNDPGTKGCIECFIPGQAPVKVNLGHGEPVTMTFQNQNPHLGPIQIKATQDGPGYTAAAATNYLAKDLLRRNELGDDEWDQD